MLRIVAVIEIRQQHPHGYAIRSHLSAKQITARNAFGALAFASNPLFVTILSAIAPDPSQINLHLATKRFTSDYARRTPKIPARQQKQVVSPDPFPADQLLPRGTSNPRFGTPLQTKSRQSNHPNIACFTMLQDCLSCIPGVWYPVNIQTSSSPDAYLALLCPWMDKP